MSLQKHALFAAGGAALAGLVAGLASNGSLHKAAVAVTTAGMRVSDAVTAETQSIVDDANDARAEARRQAKIDAAVSERLAALEDDIRAEVTAQLDAEAAGAVSTTAAAVAPAAAGPAAAAPAEA